MHYAGCALSVREVGGRLLTHPYHPPAMQCIHGTAMGLVWAASEQQSRLFEGMDSELSASTSAALPAAGGRPQQLALLARDLQTQQATLGSTREGERNSRKKEKDGRDRNLDA